MPGPFSSPTKVTARGGLNRAALHLVSGVDISSASASKYVANSPEVVLSPARPSHRFTVKQLIMRTLLFIGSVTGFYHVLTCFADPNNAGYLVFILMVYQQMRYTCS